MLYLGINSVCHTEAYMNLILMEFGYLPQYILLVKYYIQIVQQQHC